MGGQVKNTLWLHCENHAQIDLLVLHIWALYQLKFYERFGLSPSFCSVEIFDFKLIINSI